MTNDQRQIKMFNTKIKNFFLFFAIFFFMFLPATLMASETNGTIQEKYAWGENVGWVNFAPADGDVHVTDTALTGYAWDKNYGWINLAPVQSGVKNDGEGNLSGYAWSAGGGYINFSGVKINSSGKFTGIATGSVYGRVTFDCLQCNVTTDWRPSSTRSSSTANSRRDNGPILGTFGAKKVISTTNTSETQKLAEMAETDIQKQSSEKGIIVSDNKDTSSGLNQNLSQGSSTVSKINKQEKNPDLSKQKNKNNQTNFSSMPIQKRSIIIILIVFIVAILIRFVMF